MSSANRVRIADLLAARRRLVGELAGPSFLPAIELVAARLAGTFRAGGTTYLCGNGGAASDCDHIAAEFVGRFRNDRLPLPALALTTAPATITSIANDFSFDEVFARQAIAFMNERDLLVAISTSGRSVNVIRAVEAARSKGAFAIAFTSRHGDKLAECADLAVRIPATDVAQVQEAILMVAHIACEIVESLLAESGHLDLAPDTVG